MKRCAWESQDTQTLLVLANELPNLAFDKRFYYVLQIEADLLVSPIRPASPESEGSTAKPRAKGSRVRIGGLGVNEMAITRVWLARRDPESGVFTFLEPPNGQSTESPAE